MSELLNTLITLGFGYFLGLGTGLYYLKRKMKQSLGSDELDPNEMMGEVADMAEDMGIDDMVDDMIDDEEEENQNE